jgi:hypothetical protein
MRVLDRFTSKGQGVLAALSTFRPWNGGDQQDRDYRMMELYAQRAYNIRCGTIRDTDARDGVSIVSIERDSNYLAERGGGRSKERWCTLQDRSSNIQAPLELVKEFSFTLQ